MNSYYHQKQSEFERILFFLCADNHQVSLGCDQQDGTNSADSREEQPVHDVRPICKILQDVSICSICSICSIVPFVPGLGLESRKKKSKPSGVSRLIPLLSSSFPTQMVRPTASSLTQQHLRSPSESLGAWELMYR